MLIALLQAAEAAAEEAEPSKVPFYVAGGALAAWAIVLFLIGMRTPGFPRGQGAARGVMAVSTILVVAAMAATIITA